MKAYITKYALTKGIQEADAEVIRDGSKWIRAKGFYMSLKKPEWHESREDAVAQANLMRDRKIANLKKQIARLEAMEF